MKSTGWQMIINLIAAALILTACTGANQSPTLPATISSPIGGTAPPAQVFPITATPHSLPTVTLPPGSTPTLTPKPDIPAFSRIIVILFENKEFGSVIGNHQMPVYNRYAKEYTLLTAYYGIQHPSLPNYLALTAGQTFGINRDCESCFVDAPNLADQIEQSGRTWMDYQEDMPEACFDRSTDLYAVKHNPFLYYDDIRTDSTRCKQHIVPLLQLQTDIQNNQLSDFIWITPNMCHNAHDCGVDQADAWLGVWLPILMASPFYDDQTILILTWDEGQGDHGCCGYEPGGGRVPTVLISPSVRKGFEDDTPYTHYSLLKMIEQAWGLQLLEHAGDASVTPITIPFE
jgi:hypothetical protein